MRMRWLSDVGGGTRRCNLGDARELVTRSRSINQRSRSPPQIMTSSSPRGTRSQTASPGTDDDAALRGGRLQRRTEAPKVEPYGDMDAVTFRRTPLDPEVLSVPPIRRVPHGEVCRSKNFFLLVYISPHGKLISMCRPPPSSNPSNCTDNTIQKKKALNSCAPSRRREACASGYQLRM